MTAQRLKKPERLQRIFHGIITSEVLVVDTAFLRLKLAVKCRAHFPYLQYMMKADHVQAELAASYRTDEVRFMVQEPVPIYQSTAVT